MDMDKAWSCAENKSWYFVDKDWKKMEKNVDILVKLVTEGGGGGEENNRDHFEP
jgi:hypothetical protein